MSCRERGRLPHRVGVLDHGWLGRNLNMLVFETEEEARTALERIRNAPRPAFMKVESVALHRVLASF